MGFKFEVNPNELKSGIRLETSPVGSACGGFNSDEPGNLFFIVFVAVEDVVVIAGIAVVAVLAVVVVAAVVGVAIVVAFVDLHWQLKPTSDKKGMNPKVHSKLEKILFGMKISVMLFLNLLGKETRQRLFFLTFENLYLYFN